MILDYSKKCRLLFLCIIFSICCLAVFAQAGSNDATFNPLDASTNLEIAFQSTTPSSGVVNAMAIQADGRIVVGGNFFAYYGRPVYRLVRLMPDGFLDTTFKVPDNSNFQVFDLAIQPDGKILACGNMISYGGQPVTSVIRLLPDGSLDPAFNAPVGGNPFMRKMALTPDGKIYLIGDNFSTIDGHPSPGVVRLNANGSVDVSFKMDAAANTFVYTATGVAAYQGLALQSDGKILVGRSYSTGVTASRHGIFRLNPDGSLDESFGATGQGSTVRIHAISVLSDGKILIGGNFTAFRGTTCGYFTRLNDDGSVDNNFNPSGAEANFPVHAIALQPDGKILLGGNFSGYNGAARVKYARLNTDGTLDTGFNPGTSIANTNSNAVVCISPISNTASLIGGFFEFFAQTRVNHIIRTFNNGNRDGTFNLEYGAFTEVRQLLRLANSKIFMTGNFTFYNRVPLNRVAIIDEQGNVDNTFQPGSGANGNVLIAAVQPDGKIIIGGLFSSYNNVPCSSVARINIDGSLDETFQTGTGFNSFVQGIAIQPDGKIIVTGSFTTFNGVSRNRIARLNPNGSLDESFANGDAANNQVTCVKRLSNGNLLIGGTFTEYNGTPRSRIALLQPDGNLVPEFNPGTGFDNVVWNIEPMQDYFYVSGAFANYNGVPRLRIARLFYNGNIDPAFNTGTSGPASAEVRTMYIQPDGKVVAGGSFTLVNTNVSRGRIARFNTDGSHDATFDPGGTAFNGNVFALLRGTDTRRILAGGSYSTYSTIRRGGMARLRVPYSYTVTGASCLWSDPANWPGGDVQREVENGMEIIVDPASCEEFIMDIPVPLKSGGILRVAPGRKLIVQ